LRLPELRLGAISFRDIDRCCEDGRTPLIGQVLCKDGDIDQRPIGFDVAPKASAIEGLCSAPRPVPTTL
jgi:hypothetical protein